MRVRREGGSAGKNNINDRNMRRQEGLSTAGNFNYRHNTPVCMQHIYV